MNNNNKCEHGYNNFYSNTNNVNVPIFISAAKFSGIKLKIHDIAYTNNNKVLPGMSAMTFPYTPSIKQKRIFDLYIESFCAIIGYK